MPVSYIEVIDPTRLRDSLQCLRLYYFRHERHIIPKAPRIPLVYGSAVHACLAEHYRGKTAGVSLQAFEKVWEAEVIPWQNDIAETEDEKRNPARWVDVFLAYRQHYKVEPFQILNVEAPFFLPLSDDIALAGIIDLLVKYLNQIMVIDHKTTSIASPSFFASFNPNHQFSVYLLGATELLEHPVTTAIANCILTSKTELRPEKLFIRHPTTRSLSQHQMMKEEILSWWEIVRECRRRNSWPRNDDRCQRWQGGCDYHQLCTDLNTDYRRIKPSKAVFRESVWDPLRELRLAGFDQAV